MTQLQIERRLRFLSLYAGLTTLLLVVFALGAFTHATRFDVLQAERIEVLGPDGQPDLIIAAQGKMPGPIVDGVEYPRELSAGRAETAGLVFYNARGDEAGGLVYGGGRGDGTREAFGALKFDQYRQDQVVGIQYTESKSGRRAGLEVWDRPTDVPLNVLLDYARAQRSGDAPALDSLGGVIADLTGGEPTEQALVGVHRAFLGSEDGTAVLRMEDAAGRPRLRMSVDAGGSARLEFLGEAGEVIHSVPE